MDILVAKRRGGYLQPTIGDEHLEIIKYERWREKGFITLAIMRALERTYRYKCESYDDAEARYND